MSIFTSLFGKKDKTKAPVIKARKASNKSMQRFLEKTIEGISDTGVIVSNNSTQFTKLYELLDVNFSTETQERQKKILDSFSQLVNRFDDNIDISLIIINERNTKADLAERYHFPLQGDNIDTVRQDYNNMIDTKIATTHSEVSRKKYILVTYHLPKGVHKGVSRLAQAESEISLAESSLIDGVKAIDSKSNVVPVSAYKRIELMHKVLNGINNELTFEREYSRYFNRMDNDGEIAYDLNNKKLRRSNMTVRNMIAPQMISDTGKTMRLADDRYAKSYCFRNFPSMLDATFVSRITDFAYEMVTVIEMKKMPRKDSERHVKIKVNDTKADEIKAYKRAAREGYGAELINEDIIEAREAAVALRKDIVVKKKNMFLTKIVTTFFCQSEDELEDVGKLFTSACSNLSVTPSYLMFQQKAGLLTSLFASNSTVNIDRAFTSDDIKAMNPYAVQELSDHGGHFYGTNAISKNMIVYDRKRSKLANGLEFGISGSGKSFFIKGEIIANYLDGNDKIIILDPEDEYHIVAEYFGGIVIDLSLSSKWHINPCDLSMEWDSVDKNGNVVEGTPVKELLAEKCDYMVSLVEAIYGKNKECNTYEINVIHRATEKMYEEYIREMTRRHDEGCLEGQSDTLDVSLCPTLKDFYTCLTEVDTNGAGQDVADKIYQYCKGNYSIFAHHTNVPTDSRFVVYNLLKLPLKTMEVAMKVCLTSVWNDIVKNREENDKYHTGRSVWVYLDEFHHFFKTESSANTIMAYYKRVRKYGGIMTGITQDVSDLWKTEQGQAMYNNTGFYVFLNQSALGRQQIQQVHNISDALIDYINDKPVGTGLIYNNSVMIPFDYYIPKDTEMYRIMSTNPHDKEQKKAIREEADKEFEALAEESVPVGVGVSASTSGADDEFTLI